MRADGFIRHRAVFICALSVIARRDPLRSDFSSWRINVNSTYNAVSTLCSTWTVLPRNITVMRKLSGTPNIIVSRALRFVSDSSDVVGDRRS